MSAAVAAATLVVERFFGNPTVRAVDECLDA
jgi:hypothetical protein